jgi:hypothetical protein
VKTPTLPPEQAQVLELEGIADAITSVGSALEALTVELAGGLHAIAEAGNNIASMINGVASQTGVANVDNAADTIAMAMSGIANVLSTLDTPEEETVKDFVSAVERIAGALERAVNLWEVNSR